jgi:3-(3-hydroxy-phenyl)propionate hydroxylase
MLRLAMRLGRVMAPHSTIEARAQSAMIRLASRLPSVRAALQMRGRSLRHRCSGSMVGRGRWAGTLLPQPSVTDRSGHRRLLDDLLAPRWTLLVLGADRPTPAMAAEAGRVGCTNVLIEGSDFRDPSHTLQARFGRRGSILVRPDRVVMSHD